MIILYLAGLVQVSIPFVILAIFGWIIFVVGFALFNNEHP